MATKLYFRYIVKDTNITHTNYRMCGERNENIEQIISSCKTLAPSEYLNMDNNAKCENMRNILGQRFTEIWAVREVRMIPIVLGETGDIPKQLITNILWYFQRIYRLKCRKRSYLAPVT